MRAQAESEMCEHREYLTQISESATYVLIVLRDGVPRYGMPIGRRVAVLTEHKVDIAPGNLYPMLDRMVAAGVLTDYDDGDDTAYWTSGNRNVRRMYRITELGEEALLAEERRLRTRLEHIVRSKP